MDLKKLNIEQLRNLIKNARDRDRLDIAENAAIELSIRGKANSKDLKNVYWNQDRVRILMEPFVLISRSVKNNKRTSYTEAGGFKIGRSKNDPDWRWIDTYTAIKTEHGNAVFVCYIINIGSEPIFEMILDGLKKEYKLDQIDQALSHWENYSKKINPISKYH